MYSSLYYFSIFGGETDVNMWNRLNYLFMDVARTPILQNLDSEPHVAVCNTWGYNIMYYIEVYGQHPEKNGSISFLFLHNHVTQPINQFCYLLIKYRQILRYVLVTHKYQ